MTAPVLLIDGVDVTEEIYGKHFTLRLNTLDVTLIDPASIPMLTDDVESENPSWAGTVASVTVEDKDLHGGHLWVKVTATNSDEAVAAPATFGLSDEPTAGFAPAVLATVPIAHWRVGEPSGTTATDAMGAYNGTYINTPTLGATSLLTGDSDTAMTGTGASDGGMRTPTLPALTTWSIGYWHKGTAPAYTYEGIVIQPGDLFTVVGWNEGSIYYYDGTLTDTGIDVAAGGAFYVWTYNGSTLTLYKNGSSVYSAARGRAISSAVWYFGTWGPIYAAHGMSGTMDEPAIWNRALSAGEVAALYTAIPTYNYRKLVVTRTRYDGAEETRATLETLTPGLLPGMTVELTSANHNLDAADFTITDVHVSWLRDDTPLFTLSLGDAIVTMSVWLASDAIPDGSISGTKITDGSIETPKLAASVVITELLIGETIQFEGGAFVRGAIGNAYLQLDTDGSAQTLAIRVLSTAGQNCLIFLAQSGETYPRSRWYGDASQQLIAFGPGTATPDVYVARAGTKTLDLRAGQAESDRDLLLRFGDDAFPASPTTNDLFYRTDLHGWYYYDGADWQLTVADT